MYPLRVGIGFEIEFEPDAGDPHELRLQLKEDVLALPYIKEICIDMHPLVKIPANEKRCGGH